MCEWLSGAEWWDARLLCGGRALAAHRAVLASVSPFLRNLLLNCPEDGYPTFLALPDFDVEALYSVMLYIYNGEVVVPTHIVDSFLEIIITLQIYVEETCIERISSICRDSVEELYLVNRAHRKWASQKIVKSNQKEDEKNHFITVRKDMFEADCKTCIDEENIDPYCNEKEDIYLPYLQPLSDRQRKSAERDSFVTADPRAEWSNGPSAGVPHMPSGDGYLVPASIQALHANRWHNIPEESSLSSSEPNFYSSSHCHLGDDHTRISLQCSSRNSRISTDVSDTEINRQLTMTDSEFHENTSYDPTRESITNHSKPMNQVKAVEQHNEAKVNNFRSKYLRNKYTRIRNSVQKSPWCPQQPISYKPHRNKKPAGIVDTNIVLDEVDDNDSNNNIEVPTKEDKTKAKSPLVQDTVPTDDDVVEPIETKCSVCLQVLPDPESLTSHFKCHTSGRFTCNECGKTFSQLRNYKYHMSVHRGTKEFAATCPVCGKYFNDRGYLSSHMKIHRNRKEYKCPHCPKSFNQRVAYNMHVKIHTGVKPHVCSECGKAFSRKMLLKQHQRTHSGERPYACAHCDKRFADRSNMTLHLRLHTGVKPFSCSLCPKSFTKKHHLKSHLNFHTGDKPYSCPRCQLSFTQSSNMRTHFKKCKAGDGGNST